MFGLGLDDDARMTIVRPTDIPLPRGGVVFITGPSGGGKSTILRLIADELAGSGPSQVICTGTPSRTHFAAGETEPAPEPQGGSSAGGWPDTMPSNEARTRRPKSSSGCENAGKNTICFYEKTCLDSPVSPSPESPSPESPSLDTPILDLFDAVSLDRALAILSGAGLADAPLLLRPVAALSDGQRARLAIARALLEADRRGGPAIILADEFAATLDRLTAHSLARNVRKWISGTDHTFIAATTHDDLIGPLNPDIIIVKELGPDVRVITRAEIAGNHPDDHATTIRPEPS